jgi:hypothetical protein
VLNDIATVTVVADNSTPRLKRFAVLAVFLVAWTQIAIAGHQFQHNGISTTDNCEICVRLDRLDDAAVPASFATLLPCAHGTIDPVEADRPAVCRVFAYSPRAPPSL